MPLARPHRLLRPRAVQAKSCGAGCGCAKCGGPGGKPGPCPTGEHEKPAAGKVPGKLASALSAVKDKLASAVPGPVREACKRFAAHQLNKYKDAFGEKGAKTALSAAGILAAVPLPGAAPLGFALVEGAYWAVRGGQAAGLIGKAMGPDVGQLAEAAVQIVRDWYAEQKLDAPQVPAEAARKAVLDAQSEGQERPRRQVRRKSLGAGGAGAKGHWVTIGAQNHRGGTHVYLDDQGKIEKGPHRVIGKKPGQISGGKPTAGLPSEAGLPAVGLPAKKPAAEAPAASSSGPPGPAMSLPKYAGVPQAVKDHGRSVLENLGPSERAAVVTYTGNAYKKLNQAMRACPPDFRCVAGAQKKLMEGVEKALAQAPPLPAPVPVYRGLSVPESVKNELLGEARRRAESGGTFSMPSITSTSVDPHAASDFGTGVVFHIEARTGLYVDSVSQNQGEKELIQSSRTRYEVVGVTDGPRAIIHLREVPPEGQR